ncbi:hypothetical protein TNIN_294571 [Trichonephila inaurata madagascariensis]|uniref:Uncharacterized protein n=1 Tax=Trichonephila inaurata madagascariensis TaxID=2747483 RepID=A0A8X7CBU8_9ARAC|nr:hypothetical protein TNIN_294571 [Trichonephila inaurata madagascariensis]
MIARSCWSRMYRSQGSQLMPTYSLTEDPQVGQLSLGTDFMMFSLLACISPLVNMTDSSNRTMTFQSLTFQCWRRACVMPRDILRQGPTGSGDRALFHFY